MVCEVSYTERTWRATRLKEPQATQVSRPGLPVVRVCLRRLSLYK